MKLFCLVPFALFLSIGCGKSEDKPAAAPPAAKVEPTTPASGTNPGTNPPVLAEQQQLLADLDSVKVAVCACPDRACVEKTIAGGKAFDDRLDTMYEDESKIPASVKAEVDAIQKGIETCTTRIGGANAPLSAATNAVLAEFDALAVKICKCADHACADGAAEQGAALETKLENTFKSRSDIPEEALSRMAAVESRTQACIAKLPG